MLILCIPVALTYTFGKMVGSVRQGVAILAVMAILFGGWLAIASVAEHQANPAVAAAGVTHQPTGNMEGKEVRFGDTSSALYDDHLDADLDRQRRLGRWTPTRRSAASRC